MNLVFTKEKKWLEAWDDFVINNPKGNHLLYSDWLKTYTSYGFDFEIGILIDKDKIIAGYGAIIPKLLFFKFYIIPHGPICLEGHENEISNLLNQVKVRARKIGCSYLQVSIPFSSSSVISDYTFRPNAINLGNIDLKKGKLFKHIYTSYGINWIDFNTFTSPEDLLNSFTPKVRRNIRIPYNKNAKAEFAEDIDSLKEGYSVIENNAQEAGYAVRSFNDIQGALSSLIKKELAYCINIKVNGEVKASALFFKTNSYLTNIMGGVIREKPDIKLGYMLQWEAIKKSFELGFRGYNISMGGSMSVQEFKARFNAQAIRFDNPNYYIILKPFNFKIFLVLSNNFGIFKSKISKILSSFKK